MRQISNEEFVAILDGHRQWLATYGVEGDKADLRGVDLRNFDLEDVDLRDGDLSEANLRSANMQWAILRNAKLCYVDLREADLHGADLRNADLRNANLRYAKLNEANLTKTDLREADLYGADLTAADLKEADLRDVLLVGTNFISSRIYDTKVTGFDDLKKANNLGSTQGFIIDEEDEENFKEESRERDRRTEETLDVDEKGLITFYLPDSYGPAQVGRVLVFLSLLYEGVRIALFSKPEEKNVLFDKAMRPEHYGALSDKYSLKINAIEQGSVKGVLQAVKGVLEIILTIKSEWQSGSLFEEEVKQEKIKTAENEASYFESRENTLIKQAEKLTDLATRQELPEDVTEKIQNLLRMKIGQIENFEESIGIAIHVQKYASTKLMKMRDELGGEFKALDQNLLPDSNPNDNQ